MISYQLETAHSEDHPNYFAPFTAEGYILPREGEIIAVDTGKNFRNYEVRTIKHFACKDFPQLPIVRVR